MDFNMAASMDFHKNDKSKPSVSLQEHQASKVNHSSGIANVKGIGTISDTQNTPTTPFNYLCILCGAGFKSDSERESHRCTDRPVCNECGQKFESGESLERHIWTHRKQKHPMYITDGDISSFSCSCKHCGYVFKYSNFECHKCTDQFLCNFCGIKCESLAQLRNHHRGHKRSFQQELSPSEVNEQLRPHQNHTSGSGWIPTHKCCLCAEEFYSESLFQVHATMIHKMPASFRMYGKECSVCGRKFPSKNDVWQHQFSEYTCSVCLEIFTCEKEFKKHKKVHAKKPSVPKRKYQFCCRGSPDTCSLTEHTCQPYVCIVCAEGFDSYTVLEGHKCSALTCCGCDLTFSMKGELKKHMLACPSLTCQFCDETFGSDILLSAHVCPLGTCSDCGKKFEDKREMEVHYCQLYACTHCEKTFSNPKDLKAHGCQSPHCHHCGKRSPKKGEVTEKKYICNCYNKKAPQASNTMVFPLLKKFICTICGKTFQTRGNLGKHNTVCYVCKVCDEAFCKIPPLEKHVKKHTTEELHKAKLSQQEQKNKLYVLVGKAPLPGTKWRKRKKQNSPSGTVEDQFPTVSSSSSASVIIMPRAQAGASPQNLPTSIAPKVIAIPLNKASLLKGLIPTPTKAILYKCTVCSKLFHKADLKNHLCKNIACHLCKQQFASEELLKNHALESHYVSKSFHCPACKETYATAAELKQHKLKCGRQIHLSHKTLTLLKPAEAQAAGEKEKHVCQKSTASASSSQCAGTSLVNINIDRSATQKATVRHNSSNSSSIAQQTKMPVTSDSDGKKTVNSVKDSCITTRVSHQTGRPTVTIQVDDAHCQLHDKLNPLLKVLNTPSTPWTGNNSPVHNSPIQEKIISTCSLCSQTFPTALLLNVHQRNCPLATQYELCSSCGESVGDKEKHCCTNEKSQTRPDSYCAPLQVCKEKEKPMAKPAEDHEYSLPCPTLQDNTGSGSPCSVQEFTEMVSSCQRCVHGFQTKHELENHLSSHKS